MTPSKPGSPHGTLAENKICTVKYNIVFSHNDFNYSQK